MEKKKARKRVPEEIAKELEKRLNEVDELKKELGISLPKEKSSPERTKGVLEEIKVPSLKLIKEEKAEASE